MYRSYPMAVVQLPCHLTFDGYLKIYSDYETVKDEMLPIMEEQETLKDVELEGSNIPSRRFACSEAA